MQSRLTLVPVLCAAVTLGWVLRDGLGDVRDVFQRASASAAKETPKLDESKPPPVELAPTLAFSEMFESGSALKPSAKAMRLNGKRVRLVGFMAEMELPPEGALYLVPYPLHCDEAGGGTADLPLESVLVLLPPGTGKSVPNLPGALEATGVLEVGNRTDTEGRSANFRLTLSQLPALAGPGETRASEGHSKSAQLQ